MTVMHVRYPRLRLGQFVVRPHGFFVRGHFGRKTRTVSSTCRLTWYAFPHNINICL